MDRRAFLKTLSALGLGTMLPADLVGAAGTEVDVAWRDAAASWDLFVVSEYGTLSYANMEEPRTRREAGRFGAADTIDVNDVECYWSLRSRIQALYAGRLEEEALARGEAPEWRELFDKAEEACLDWFARATGAEREAIVREIEEWLEEPPDGEEWEDFYKQSDPQGLAYCRFVYEDREICEQLGIVVVEGEQPGSSYFAAELRGNVDEANRIAEARGWSLRFVRESDVPV